MENKEKQIQPLTDTEAKEMWGNIISRIRAHEARKKKRQISYILGAAILLLFVSIVTYRNYSLPTSYYAKETAVKINLNDGSQVTLLKGAKLTVEKSFPSETRDVYLEGDAIFKVAKSKLHPFIVHTPSYEAKVLGTIFKVVQNRKFFNVDLYEGKVQISKVGKPREFYILLPHHTFSNLGSENIVTIARTKGTKTLNGKTLATLSFNDVPVAEAINLIERTYGVKIKFPPNQLDAKLNFSSTDATAQEILEKIAIQLNLNIRKNDNTFELED